ncbi:MAG TPA: hypothetical protein DD471_05110 [Planctomycetes bacterium]|nr:hypothetical protein [Planctomycetota bacterium]
MLLPPGPLGDPLFDQLNLRRVELQPGLLRRHALIFILVDKAKVEFALFRLTGDNQLLIVQFRAKPLLCVEAQVRLALALIRPVAFEAIVTEQRTNLPVEVNLLRPAPAGT